MKHKKPDDVWCDFVHEYKFNKKYLVEELTQLEKEMKVPYDRLIQMIKKLLLHVQELEDKIDNTEEVERFAKHRLIHGVSTEEGL